MTGIIRGKEGQYSIRQAEENDAEIFFDHMVRHIDESGNGDIIFQPGEWHKTWVRKKFIEKLKMKWSAPIGHAEWEIAWLLENGGEIVGHVDLRSLGLETSSHRVMLGMGLERSARRQGYGNKLAEKAIAWARNQKLIEWIDLRVFAHNGPALKLYRSFGFAESGIVRDLFRVNDESIDDIRMVLNVADKSKNEAMPRFQISPVTKNDIT